MVDFGQMDRGCLGSICRIKFFGENNRKIFPFFGFLLKILDFP